MSRITLGLCLALVLSAPSAWAKTPLTTETAKVSYLLGLQFGTNLTRQGVELDLAAIAEGLQDGTKGVKPQLSEEEAAKVMNDFRQKLTAKMEAQRSKMAGENQKSGQAFLDKNKKEAGVKVTKSGLQYKVLTEGKGAKPKTDSKVKVHYEGKLTDGTLFDSSYKRGEPAVFPVTGVIPGWTEALGMMSVGSKWHLVIPAELAYGDRGMGGAIPPNSVLTFDVELLGIE
ncbi:MAG: hypothetical protein A2600_13930 [Candidatus Lambdaproteobacteria bacterium RIFOXYD1_FULL_56_27]|uniref:Peptidyl-prolyl cis-trans isomerase n=1 Tax=Candidatus Lambdaproteobacteria bacterium RIFOXYD2_FULL_56_26 TaxID=1817773 RepID=A0A1F6GNW0_9PROT|nr:MAG: hypothetical protein A2557_06155 [Candidatus Lambdaproteobacteria bacterium RIFOXYD2_FULL_56_26]OGG99888.1 MAG: hypothetical protein A2426_09890 [Candidatus Lambdaproteobacteria bacterium RIFOXYC1_FULL_56_13]OGH06287.1 MAG: hypothetical protein A2600_13930 [Candidatus Lambdaproteobacteria bacterium RIFOXYD1_FULL_56_27]